MFEQINSLENVNNTQIISRNVFKSLLGDLPVDMQPEVCIEFLKIVSTNVYSMYRVILSNREGVGRYNSKDEPS